MGRRFFVGGNFKMNGSISSVKEIVNNLNGAKLDPNTEVVVAPSAIHLLLVRESLKKEIAVAAQNIYYKKNGAFTGELSVEQLNDAGIAWTLLGHSERRVSMAEVAESNEFLAEKAKAALAGGVGVIFCCGESLEIRKENKTKEHVLSQLKSAASAIKDWSKVVIAYEPIWAIGTGEVASPEQAQEVHADIRAWLKSDVSPEAAENTRIIYGGSVSEKNCVELAKKPDIDGFLVGGASLKPAFVDIINAKSA
ncbi:triosephosphate isomerase [Pseudovirgaria hyperparasitica]|uniref:Triosephosphate isomerase n=1 Tax=Pseudovirgaria hyperparasitica TaxID=470096 RepID=A0A6A6WKK5_9PEZI|nr:triosephosphate isomerase [Pseudovirgaria hyperparasitica]KAF2762693.1 triosephosphate isomerase [Pseudovirgaria hyperparasitica]